jgi:predicted RNA-binding protein with PUA-like domain
MTKVERGAHKDRKYWLMKSEPGTFSIDDLWKATGRTTHWDGVRNFQARNFMRDEMKKGDLAFFYHSGAEPGIVGIVEIVKDAYPDRTALDPKDPHYDPNSKNGETPWVMVDIHGVEKFSRPIPLSELRTKPELEGMPLLQKGNRLSVQRVGAAEWNAVIHLAKQAGG